MYPNNFSVNPNLNAEAYRNLDISDHPMNDKHLEFVLIHKDNGLLLGSSNMTDRYWYGTLWYFDKLDNLERELDRNTYTSAVRTASGVCDAVFLGRNNKFAVGEDSGVVLLYEINPNNDTQAQELQFSGFSYQHDDSVTSLSAFQDGTFLVSGGMDCCIKVYDVAEKIVTYSYNQAQTNVITSVATQVESDSVFVSTSLDSEAILWDIRDPKPANGLWENKNCGLTAATWKPNDQNTIVVGTEDGSILILDIRKTTSEPIYQANHFVRSVKKLMFNSNYPTLLAGCCDAEDLKVFDVDNNNVKVLKEDVSHSDFVRGLTWQEKDLITCSWDNKVLRHRFFS